MLRRLTSTLGFTLIEMAIVLVVIGLVLSGGLFAISPVLQSSHVSETNAKLDRIEQAMVLYVIRYGCLPCPTPTTALVSPATNIGWAGAATPYSSGCTATCTVTGTSQGIVPWVNLGLSESDATDGFGYLIDYAIDTGDSLQTSPNMVRTPPTGYPATTNGLVVQKTTTFGSAQTTNAAAYVLISHGSDHSWAWAISGTQTGDPHGSADQSNNKDGSPFVQDDTVAGGGSYFDDIVRFRTAAFIIQLCGSNACGNPS